MRERADFKTRVKGIPCGVVVDSFNVVEPQGKFADSDLDCYGYTEIEYHLLDRKGYRAKWLENKMTDKDKDLIEIEILERGKP